MSSQSQSLADVELEEWRDAVRRERQERLAASERRQQKQQLMSPAFKGGSGRAAGEAGTAPLTLEEYRRAITRAAPGPPQSHTRIPAQAPPAPSSRSQSANSSARRDRHADPFAAKIDPLNVTFKTARSVVSSQRAPPSQICVRRNAYGALDSYTEEVTLFHLRQYAQRSTSASETAGGSAPDWHREPLQPTREPRKVWRKEAPTYLASRPAPRSLHIRQNYVENQRKKPPQRVEPKVRESVEDSLLYGLPAPPAALLTPQPANQREPQGTALVGVSDRHGEFVLAAPPPLSHPPVLGSPVMQERRMVAPPMSPVQQGSSWIRPTDVPADVEVSPPTPAALRAQQIALERNALLIPSMRFARPDLFQGHGSGGERESAPVPQRAPEAIIEHLEMQLNSARTDGLPSRPPPPEPRTRVVPTQPRLDGAESIHDAAENARALLAQLTSRTRFPR
jgi:hypothetical protein